MTVLARARGGMILDVMPDRPPLQKGSIELGARVNYTRRAAVIRWKREVPSSYTTSGSRAKWIPVEGCERGWRPTIARVPRPEEDILLRGLDAEHDPFWTTPPEDGVNKNVVVWSELGGGVVIGLVRRGIGRSYSASGGTGGLFDDSFEPGGFAAEAYVWLYMVKARLEGKFYSLVPHWAVVA